MTTLEQQAGDYVMLPCIGCKHLVSYGRSCDADAQYERIQDPLTGRVSWYDPRFPDEIFRPSPAEMRATRCGLERKFYEPTLIARLNIWMFGHYP